jgi:hypothetical protein
MCVRTYTCWFGEKTERGKEKGKEERERIAFSHRQNGSHFFMLLERANRYCTHIIIPLRVMRTLKGDYYIYVVVCQVQSNVPFLSSVGTKRNNRYAHSIHIGWLVGSQTPNPNNGGSWFDAHVLHPSTTHPPFRHIWKEHSEKGYI